MFLVALIVALVLVVVAAVQFCYMMFLESVNRQHKQRIAELERVNATLAEALADAEVRLEEEAGNSRETWPEIIDGDDNFSVR